MKCPKCDFENPAEAKFCVECGNKFEMSCPACGFGNLPSFKFCSECGEKLDKLIEHILEARSFDDNLEKIQKYLPKGIAEKILAQKGKIEGERKQVTVMFCDMAAKIYWLNQLNILRPRDSVQMSCAAPNNTPRLVNHCLTHR